MKTGMVLEGGAMRGMYTAGVLDVMMENDVKVDGVIGVSAGAVFGCNYKSKQIGRAIRYNMKYCSDERYVSIKSLIKTGDLYGAEFCYNELPNRLDIFDLSGKSGRFLCNLYRRTYGSPGISPVQPGGCRGYSVDACFGLHAAGFPGGVCGRL